MNTRTPFALVTALAALILTAGCWTQPPNLAPFTPQPAQPPDPPSHQVVVFGDSLGRMAQDPALALFAQHPDMSVSYNTQGGTEVTDWIDAMANVDQDDLVVFELGTNDLSAHTIDVAVAQLHQGLDELADAQCIVAFTLNTTSGDLRGAPFAQRTHEYNDALRQARASGAYPQLRLYDWNAQSGRLGPSILSADQLHHNATGNDIYAQAIVDAATSCTMNPTVAQP